MSQIVLPLFCQRKTNPTASHHLSQILPTFLPPGHILPVFPLTFLPTSLLIYIPTYLSSYLYTFLDWFLLIYLCTQIHYASLLTYQPTNPPHHPTTLTLTHQPTYQPTHQPMYPPTHLPTYPPTHLPTNPPTHLPT